MSLFRVRSNLLSIFNSSTQKKLLVTSSGRKMLRFLNSAVLIRVRRRNEKILFTERRIRYLKLERLEKMAALPSSPAEWYENEILKEIVLNVEATSKDTKLIHCRNHKQILKVKEKMNRLIKIVIPPSLSPLEEKKCARACKACYFAMADNE